LLQGIQHGLLLILVIVKPLTAHDLSMAIDAVSFPSAVDT
jgi:hypothetical protein